MWYEGVLMPLLSQSLTGFHQVRTSENNYDGAKSGGSNRGPTSKKLINKIIFIAKELKTHSL